MTLQNPGLCRALKCDSVDFVHGNREGEVRCGREVGKWSDAMLER